MSNKSTIIIANIDKEARAIEYDKFYTEYNLESVAEGNNMCICSYCINKKRTSRSCCKTGIKCKLFKMKEKETLTEVIKKDG